MPGAESIGDSCQVDFYLQKEGAADASEYACQLALMAWEQGQRIFVATASSAEAQQVDELMWQTPPGRFLPHSTTSDRNADKAAIRIGEISDLILADVVINLGAESIPGPERFRRILEIVPFAPGERHAAREKYKSYRDQGLTPRTNEIS